MLLLKRKTFEIESDSARVSAGDAAVIARAEDVIAAAEAEAAHIAEEAKALFESERKRGYAEGIEQANMDMLDRKIGLVDEAVRYIESIEGKMGEIVMKALRKCLAEIGDRECVCQIVKKAMQAVVRTQRQLTIRVAPETGAAVRERVEAIRSEFPTLNRIDVVEDPQMKPTSCAVETESGCVEGSVEGQLRAIEKSLKKYLTKDGTGV